MSELRRCSVCGEILLDYVERFVCVHCNKWFCGRCARRDGSVVSTALCADCIVKKKEPKRCPKCGIGVPVSRPVIVDGKPTDRRFCPVCNEYVE